MKAIVKNNEGQEIECKITRDKNKLLLEFENEQNIVPWTVIKNSEFKVTLEPTEDEISCGSCDHCLTPIC